MELQIDNLPLDTDAGIYAFCVSHPDLNAAVVFTNLGERIQVSVQRDWRIYTSQVKSMFNNHPWIEKDSVKLTAGDDIIIGYEGIPSRELTLVEMMLMAEDVKRLMEGLINEDSNDS